MDIEVNKLEKITHEIDHLYQEGAIFYPSDVKTIEISVKNLQGILKDLKNPAIQKIFHQVREL